MMRKEESGGGGGGEVWAKTWRTSDSDKKFSKRSKIPSVKEIALCVEWSEEPMIWVA